MAPADTNMATPTRSVKRGNERSRDHIISARTIAIHIRGVTIGTNTGRPNITSRACEQAHRQCTSLPTWRGDGSWRGIPLRRGYRPRHCRVRMQSSIRALLSRRLFSRRWLRARTCYCQRGRRPTRRQPSRRGDIRWSRDTHRGVSSANAIAAPASGTDCRIPSRFLRLAQPESTALPHAEYSKSARHR